MADAQPNPNFGGITLKALLENPNLLLPPPPVNNNNGNGDDAAKGDKDDFFYDSEAVDMAAAFLGPTLWDKTLPCDSDLKLEYMDIDEFLAENGIQVNSQQREEKVTPSSPSPTLPEDNQLNMPQFGMPQIQTPLSSPPLIVDTTESSVITQTVQETNLPTSPSLPASPPESVPPVTPPSPPREPSPVNVDIRFELSSTDVALATAPGQSEFNPREKVFTDEELKPQPMVKKSKKQYVPEELKDEKYWERRRKNNIAAKRSRDARRVKENQIVIRTSFLEQENTALKEQVLELKKETLTYKKLVASYEKKLHELKAL